MDITDIHEFEIYCKEQLNLSEHSLRAYRQDLNTFQKFICIQNQKSALINQKTIIEYQQYLRETLCSSPATIRRRIITLRSFFQWKSDQNTQFYSPFNELRLDLKIPRRLPRPLDRATLSCLFNNSRRLVEVRSSALKQQEQKFTADQITGIILRLMLVTGMRVSEMMNLKVKDVTGAATRIRVHGKGNRERTVYVTNQSLLDDFLFLWQSRYQQSGIDGVVFLNSRGRPLTSAALRKRLVLLSCTLPIETNITPHRFRHSAATLLIEEGVDIRIVQRLLGHASIATTEIYTKVSDNSLIEAVRKADTLATLDS